MKTWENGSWAMKTTLVSRNQITVDEDLGLVYLPVEDPTSGLLWRASAGNSLFAESLHHNRVINQQQQGKYHVSPTSSRSTTCGR